MLKLVPGNCARCGLLDTGLTILTNFETIHPTPEDCISAQRSRLQQFEGTIANIAPMVNSVMESNRDLQATIGRLQNDLTNVMARNHRVFWLFAVWPNEDSFSLIYITHGNDAMTLTNRAMCMLEADYQETATPGIYLFNTQVINRYIVVEVNGGIPDKVRWEIEIEKGGHSGRWRDVDYAFSPTLTYKEPSDILEDEEI